MSLVRKRFVAYKDALFLMKCFDANEKKGRCFSPSAQKNTNIGFVHNKAIHTRAKGKMVLQGINKYVQYLSNCQLQFLAI
jgi:hypothetical protein